MHNEMRNDALFHTIISANKAMIASLFKLLFGRLVPALVLLVAVFIGWCNLDTRYPWDARFYHVMLTLANGYLPPILFGHGKLGAKMTPPVPEDMKPRSRPKKEMFAKLLGSGDKMPLNGLGMCCRPTAYDDVCVERSVEWYLLLGGRHIDGAHLYMNHEAIGHGIRNAIARGVPRKEVFLTSKVFPSHYGYGATTEVVESSLGELGLDYLDMVLMHAPDRSMALRRAEECRGKTDIECRQETWRALSDLRAAGKIRNAGVANFHVNHIEELLELRDGGGNSSKVVAPVTNNQIPWNPWASDKFVETVEFCKSKNIQITAWNSLGGTTMESEKAKQLEVLASLSEKHGRSIQQIMLRWALQGGAAIIPGTGNPKYMEENLSVYGFKLSNDDMASINGLRKEIADQFMAF